MSERAINADSNDLAALVEAMPDGWKTAMGIRVVRATPEEVVAELEIGPEHLQPMGIVHGGVHCGVIETVASIGANLTLFPLGKYAVGLENHTSFIQAVRVGKLRAVGKPLHSGKSSRVWEVSVHAADGSLAATGRVRLHVIDRGSKLGGAKAEVDPREPSGK